MLTFKIGRGRVNCLAFSPRGDRLAVGSSDRTVYLLQWPGGDIAWRLPAPNNRCVARCIGFRDDGETLFAIFSDARSLEWQTYTGRLLAAANPTWMGADPRPIGAWYASDELGWEWAYARQNAFATASIGSSFERERFPDQHRPGWVWPVHHHELLALGRKVLYHYQRLPEKFEKNPTILRQVLSTLFRPLIGSHAPALQKLSQVAVPGPVARAAALWPDQQSLLIGTNKGHVRRVGRTHGETLHQWGLPLPAIHSLAIAPDATVAAAGSNRGALLIWDLDD